MSWRFHLLTLPDRVWVDRDVPLQGGQVAEAVNGPAAISGYLPAGYANRAAVKASTTQPSIAHVTGRWYDAMITPTSANGNANTVCGSLTKLA